MDHLEKRQRKTHPKESSNFISNIFFIYTVKLFRKGFKKELEEKDLYEVLPDYRSKKLGDRLEEEWQKQKKNGKTLSVVRLLRSCYGLSYLLLGFMQLLINLIMTVVQPYSLGKLIAYFTPGQTQLTKEDAYIHASIVIVLAGFGIKVRTAFCSFMYRKVLKLSPASLGEITVGKMVTLMTKDVDAFEKFIEFGNELWITIVKTIVCSCILYSRIGVAAFAGIVLFFVIIPLQIFLGKKVASLKIKMSEKTDDRLQITQKVLSAIRIIKMYTWEKFFDAKVSNVRKKEINTTFKISLLRSAVMIFGSVNAFMAFYIMMMSYIFLGNNITAETVYFVLTTFHSLAFSLSVVFPIALNQTAELRAAIQRVGTIVNATEVHPEEPKTDVTILPKISLKDVTVTIENTTILHEINMNIDKGLTLIIGPLGSGKSFLLRTILQDYELEKGTLTIQGDISYASQEPWLFPSSIKQNILFGQEYDESRYREVLKVCALIYDFELLEAGDGTIVEDRGSNLSRGQLTRINLARAIYKDSSIYLLDDCLSALDAHVSAFIFEECIRTFLKEKLVILVTHNTNYLKDADHTIILDSGRVTTMEKSPELNENKLLEFIDDERTRKVSSSEDVDEEDAIDEETKLITETTTEKKVYQEEKKSGKVDSRVYKKYIQYGGGFVAFFLVFCTYVATQLSLSSTNKLLSLWVNAEEKFSNHPVANSTNTIVDLELKNERSTVLSVYSIMIGVTVVFIFVRALVLLLFVRKASIKLHKNMMGAVINGSMYFFDTHFIGSILNRFSKDLAVVDGVIPSVLDQTFRAVLILSGIVGLIASVNVMFLIPITIFLVILVVLRRCIIPTGRSLKRLEALTKSPVVGHMNSSLEGLTTIRAFKAENILRDEFDRHQDLYTSASYLLMSNMTGFAFFLDTICCFLITFIVMRFLVLETDALGGDVGLAVSQAFLLTGTLQALIRQWAEVENQMTSVERTMEYIEIKQENKQGSVWDNWPKRGEITYQNVNLAYTNSNEYVLKNINFAVKPNEKIGIVGRTGAGKSSIVSSLFRLYEVEGKIIIDDVDIKTVSLEFLRSNISIIPQDPVLFSGTIRDNIDPTKIYPDEEIWAAIETANLKKLIPGLDFEIVQGGSNFSVGQRQLVCLARALVLKNKIVVLDEATANMDSETDELIHKMIKENFVSCTVFTVAHKLNSIMDSDRVMVLDKGEIVEYDEPGNLLQNKDGIFYKMVAKSGLL